MSHGAAEAGLVPLRAAVIRAPDDPGPRLALGEALLRLGRAPEAEMVLRRAADLAPDHGAARRLLGRALRSAGRAAAAEAAFRAAISLDSGDAASCNDLGILLARTGRLAAAVPFFEMAAARDPGGASAHANLCAAYGELGQLEAAVVSGRRAVALDPGHANAHANLGTVLDRLGHPDRAVAAFAAALSASPRHVNARANLGLALTRLGLFEEGLAALGAALRAEPGHAQAQLSLATTMLLLGRLEEGFAAYEHRPKAAAPDGTPTWMGEPLAGKTVRLEAEQGLGDTIQFVRYVPEMVRRGARVHLVAPAPLAPLLRGMAGIDLVLAPGAAGPAADFRCPLPSLPHRFGTRLETIPAPVPYLRASPEAVGRWQARIGGLPGRRIGLVWAGNPAHRNDNARTIAFARLAPLWDVPGVSWVSLQCGSAAAALGDAPPGRILDISSGLHDFGETAGALANLDLLITVDTSVAHLAGAMGLAAWVLLACPPDWRWLLERGESPWYPTLRLFRQEQAGDWEGVLCRVSGVLNRH